MEQPSASTVPPLGDTAPARRFRGGIGGDGKWGAVKKVAWTTRPCVSRPKNMGETPMPPVIQETQLRNALKIRKEHPPLHPAFRFTPLYSRECRKECISRNELTGETESRSFTQGVCHEASFYSGFVAGPLCRHIPFICRRCASASRWPTSARRWRRPSGWWRVPYPSPLCGRKACSHGRATQATRRS